MMQTLKYKVKNILIWVEIEKNENNCLEIKNHLNLERVSPQVQWVLYNLVELLNEGATRAILYNYVNKNKHLDYKEIKFFEIFIGDLLQL